MSINPTNPEPDTNPDLVTGEPGSHPLATGVGAATLGAVGLATAAAVAGPVGVAVALLGGSIIGGYVGKAAGEVIEPTNDAARLEVPADERPTVKLEP